MNTHKIVVILLS